MGTFIKSLKSSCCSSQEMPEDTCEITSLNSTNKKSDKKNISASCKIKNVKNSIQSYEFDDFKEKMIKLHNDLRKKYGSDMLKENNILNDIAEEYADKLSNEEKYDFNNNIYNNITVGENISVTDFNNPEEIFKTWAEEEAYYEFKPNISTKTNHFTQLIWKETTDIGIGFSSDLLHGKYYTVILYYPIGNSLGDLGKNLSLKTEIDFDNLKNESSNIL